jgi:hypothetical protein
MVSVSLWAVPVGARSFQKKYNAKQVPHVTLVKDVSSRRVHHNFPPTIHLEAQSREMVVRKVGDKYEYGWVLYNKDELVFMSCHTTNKNEKPPSHISLLESNVLDTVVTYSFDGVLVDPSDVDTVATEPFLGFES